MRYPLISEYICREERPGKADPSAVGPAVVYACDDDIIRGSEETYRIAECRQELGFADSFG